VKKVHLLYDDGSVGQKKLGSFFLFSRNSSSSSYNKDVWEVRNGRTFGLPFILISFPVFQEMKIVAITTPDSCPAMGEVSLSAPDCHRHTSALLSSDVNG
jgi:hypothetical protein